MECFFGNVIKKIKERGFVPKEGQDDFEDFLIRGHQSALADKDSDDAHNENKENKEK